LPLLEEDLIEVEGIVRELVRLLLSTVEVVLLLELSLPATLLDEVEELLVVLAEDELDLVLLPVTLVDPEVDLAVEAPLE